MYVHVCYAFTVVWMCVHNLTSSSLPLPPPLPPPPLSLQPSAFTLSQKTILWPLKAFVPHQKAWLSWKAYSCNPSGKGSSPQEDFGHSKHQWLVCTLQTQSQSCCSRSVPTAGVLFNLLPLLQEPVYTTTMRAILSVMAAALDVGVDGLLLQLATQPRPPAEQGQHTEQVREDQSHVH